MRARNGGVEGNERLTVATGLVLLLLLAAEGITLLFMRPLLPEHVFIGMMLVPPVLLKLGSTGWRFMRYYQRRREYVERGPPHSLMRFLVGPALVFSTVGVLGTGIAMIAFGRRGMIVGLHKASFVVWAGAFGVHVLVYLRRLLGLLRPATTTGGGLRVGTVGVSLLAGVALAAVTYPVARPWVHGFDREHHEAVPARVVARPASAAHPVLARRAARAHRVPLSPATRALGLPPVVPARCRATY